MTQLLLNVESLPIKSLMFCLGLRRVRFLEIGKFNVDFIGQNRNNVFRFSYLVVLFPNYDLANTFNARFRLHKK